MIAGAKELIIVKRLYLHSYNKTRAFNQLCPISTKN